MRSSAVALGFGFLLAAHVAAAADLRLAASASKDDVVPPTSSIAIGDLRMTFHQDTGHFDLDVKVRGMTPADVTNSFIHLAVPGANGPIVFVVGSAYSAVPDGIELTLTDQTFPPADVAALLAGGTYFDVDTSTFFSGAIRGQILPLSRKVDYLVPGSATVARQHGLVALADGGFISVWRDKFGFLNGERFAADGSLVSGPFFVGTGGPPDLAPLPTGFVGTWLGPNGTDVMEKRLDANGSGESPLFTVGTNALDDPAVSTAPDGRFVVVWDSSGDIFARRFDAAGNPLGATIQVTATTLLEQEPDVAVAPDGSFLVTWYYESPATNFFVQARRFDASGLGGSVFAVNDGAAVAGVPHAAADPTTGEFVVVWNENELITRGRRFTNAGAPIGASFPLDASAPQHTAEISRGVNGEFVAAIPLDSDVDVRRFARDGSPASAESRAPAGASTANFPKVAIGPQGEAWVSWIDGNDSVQVDRIPALQTHWSANEGHGVRVSDSAGNADDVGTRMSPAWGNGISGTGLAFNGVDDFVLLNAGGEEEVASSVVTVSAWVKIPALPSAIDEPFHGILDSGNDSYVLYLDRGNAELRFKATNSAPEAQRPGIPEAMLRVGEWMYIVGVYDGPDGQARIYLDGQLVTTRLFVSAGLPLMLPAGVLAIGRDGANYQYFFQGAIDEVKIWNRVISPNELLAEAGRRFDDEFESGNLVAWSAQHP